MECFFKTALAASQDVLLFPSRFKIDNFPKTESERREDNVRKFWAFLIAFFRMIWRVRFGNLPWSRIKSLA